MDAARPPTSAGESGRELAVTYAPLIRFDAREPFFPTVAGYTIFTGEADSPSADYVVGRSGLPRWTQAIEYAIWWDWDITHLYELEHVWSYVDARGELVAAEGSWHGQARALRLAGGTLPHKDAHPVVCSQPGKHAFAPAPDWFEDIRAQAEADAGPDAGKDGVLVKPVYVNAGAKIPKIAGLKIPTPLGVGPCSTMA
jgi:hypothetical protein